jgi:hypothetical protein
MGRSRFVQPETIRIDLSDGDYLILKKELNAGEQRRVFSDFVKQARSGEPFELDPEKVGLTKMVAYLVSWSFCDQGGLPVEVSESAIKALDLESFREVKDAIDAHETQVEAEREARKNGKAGTLPSGAISASLG